MRALLLLLAALWSPYVAAQAAPSVTYGVNGGTLVPGTLSDVGSGYRTWSNNDSVPGGARVSDKHNVRFGPSANADVYSNRRIPWNGVAKALRWAGTAGLVIGAGSAIYDAWQAAGLQPNGNGFNGSTGGEFVTEVYRPAWDDKFRFRSLNDFGTWLYPLAAGPSGYTREAWGVGGTVGWNCGATGPHVCIRWRRASDNAVTLWSYAANPASSGCFRGSQYVGQPTNGVCAGEVRAFTDAEVQAALDAAAASGAVRGGDVLREAVGQGYVVPPSDAVALPSTGPASVASPPRTLTTTSPTGQVSTQVVPGPVYNITYNTNSYTYTVTETAPAPGGGTVAETKEPEPSCGLPGQPACQVKVDESGTPSATSPDLSVFESLKTQDAQKVSEALSSVPEPSFGFIGAPPIVACRPVPLPNDMGEIDACNVVDTVRELMGFLWALAAAWISLGWIREAVNGG